MRIASPVKSVVSRSRRAVLLVTLWFVAAAAPAAGQTPLSMNVPNNLGTYSVGDIQYSLSASGGTGTYTWSITGGALPPGMHLRSDGPSWQPNLPTLAGVVELTTATTFNFTLTLTDGVTTINRACQIRVTPLAITEYWTLPTAHIGQLYTYQLKARTNGAAVTWSTPAGGLPAGFSLTSGGLLSGIPSTSNFFSATIQLTNGVDTVSRFLTIPVYDLDFSPGVLPNAVNGVPYTATIHASGGTAPYTFSVSATSSTYSLNPTTGVLTGTFTGVGQWYIYVTVTDSAGLFRSKYVTVNVDDVPGTLPTIYANLQDGCTVGMPCALTASHQSGGAAPFSWSASGLPDGLYLRFGEENIAYWSSPGDAQIFGAAAASGNYPVTLTITDANGLSTTSTFNLHIARIWSTNYPSSGTINVPYSHTLRVIGGTQPYGVTVLQDNLPYGVSFDPATLRISGTPLENGTNFYLQVRHTDASGDAINVWYSFSIAGPANATIQNSDNGNLGSFTVNSSYSRQLNACCVPSYAWSVVTGSVLPPGLSLTADGRLSGFPTTVGTYSFLVRVQDATFAANYAIRRYTLTITPVPTTPPTSFFISNASPLPYGNASTPYSVTLLTSGGTAPVTFALSPLWGPAYPLPPGLSLSLDGVLGGTPTASGQYQFGIRATDSAGNVADRGFTLFIYPAGQAPPLRLPTLFNGSVALGTVFSTQLVPSGGIAPYQVSFTPGAVSIPGSRVQNGQPLPPNFAVTAVGGFLGLLATPGVYPSSIRVTDAAGTTMDRALNITVSPFLLRTLSPIAAAIVGVPYSFTLRALNGNGAYVWTSTNTMPPGLALNPSTGEVSGTPTLAGSYSIPFTLSDSSGAPPLTTSISLTVNPFAIITNGVLPIGTVGVPYSQTISAPDCAGCSWSASGLFAGLSINATTGVVSGTSTGQGLTTVTVTATGSNGTVQKRFFLVMNPAIAGFLTITNTPPTQATIGGFLTTQLTASGGVRPYTWSHSGGTLPPGVAIDGPGEQLGGFLNPGETYLFGRATTPGLYTYSLTVTDATGSSVTREFTTRIVVLSILSTSLPATGRPLTYNVPYSQGLVAAGGTNSYTWTQTGGALPPGLTLGSDGFITGTPTNTGSFSMNVLVTDTAGNQATTTVSLFVSGPGGGNLTLTLPAPVIQRGATFSSSLTISGGTAPYTVTALSALPPGFELLSGSSLPSGFAPGSFVLAGFGSTVGVFSFTIQVQDAAGNIAVRTSTVSVTEFALLTGVTLREAAVGAAYSQAILTVSAGAVTWSLAAGAIMPPGLGVSAAGVISGTPTTAGNFSFALVATPATGPSRTFTFFLTVTTINITTPEILPNAIWGAVYTATLAATGGGASRTWSATGLPSGLTMSAAGVMTGTPNGSFGQSVIFVTVNDGIATATKRFTLFVLTALPLSLEATSSLGGADFFLGQQVTLTLTATGGRAPYTWSLAPGSSLPPGLQLIAASQINPLNAPGAMIIVGTPTAAGTFTFELLLRDADNNEARRPVTIVVAPIALIPAAPPTATTGTAYAFQFLGAGGTGPYSFSMAPASLFQEMLPPGLLLSTAGLLAGTPESTGVFTFRLTAQDALGRTVTRLFALTVNSPSGLRVNLANPFADPTLGSGRRSASLSATSSAPMAWTLAAGPMPAGLALTPTTPPFGSAGGTAIAGQPTAAGLFTFRLRATDTTNASNTAEHVFSVRISPLQLVSPAVGLNWTELPAAVVGAAYTTTLKAAGGIAPYTFAFSPFTPAPAGLTLNGSGVLAGTPTAAGTYSLNFVITDNAGQQLRTETVTLTVRNAGRSVTMDGNPTMLEPQASVGAPFFLNLDSVLVRAQAPLTWVVLPGPGLPPGLQLVRGGNGISDHLVGTPTAAGSYVFFVEVTDANGQKLSGDFELNVSPLTVSPSVLAPARVGTPYSATFDAGGGTGPYTLAASPFGDMPPGLTLTGSVLSGTPTHAGHFTVLVTVTDSAARTLVRAYPISVDDAAGSVNVLSITPSPVQLTFTLNRPAPPTVPVSIGATSGSFPVTLAILGIPGASLSTTSGTAPFTVNVGMSAPGVGAGTYTGALAASAPGSANRIYAVPVILTVADAPPCTYTLVPSSGSVNAFSGTGSFSVSTPAGCAWTALSEAPTWLIITRGASGNGPGTVSFSASPNASASQRSGTINVNGVRYTLTQFGTSCSFAVSPAAIAATSAGGVVEVTITASASTCAWTASGLGVSSTSGTGSARVNLTVPPNTAVGQRTLTATVANQLVTVTQSGIDCTATLSPPGGASFDAAAGSGSIAVTTAAACGYSTIDGPSWITVTAGGSGTGPGTVQYTVAANASTSPRSGSLTVGGVAFPITQAGVPCSFTLDTSLLGSPYGPAAGSGTVNITANGTNCAWNASSSASWLSVVPASGTGSGMVTVSATSNAAATDARLGALTIANQALQVTQAGTACTYRLQSDRASVPAGGAAGAAGVVAPSVCGWTVSSDSSWLQVTQAPAGGSGDVQFFAQPNSTPFARVGVLTIAGLPYEVTQAGLPCSYTLAYSNVNVAAVGVTGESVGFSTTATGCSPAAVSFASWLTVTTTFSGTAGTVFYSALPNPLTTTRTGTIQIGDRTFTVNQTGGLCAYSLHEYGAVFTKAGGSGNVFGSRSALGCTPSTFVDQPNIVTLGTLTGPENNIFTQPYTVSANPALNATTRIGRINFGGQIFVIKQVWW